MSATIARSDRAVLPPSYRPLADAALPAGVSGVARDDVADTIATAVGTGGSLHRWASRQPGRRELHGRGVAWAVRLPDGPSVVVRHNRHGGLFAPLTGDRFLVPTRAPSELATAVRLADAAVPTPAVLAYLLYPAGPLLRRVDVATLEIADGADLPAALERWPTHRTLLLDATARLVAQLTRAGARHPDLNVKNVLLTVHGDTPLAHVLDVDRISFGEPGDPRVTDANMDRLARSVRRWRERRGVLLDDGELRLVERLAREAA
ncbi:MAG: lipopolysaccharide kinase InaA family protein [Gemmatimonadaceae bacterium]